MLRSFECVRASGITSSQCQPADYRKWVVARALGTHWAAAIFAFNLSFLTSGISNTVWIYQLKARRAFKTGRYALSSSAIRFRDRLAVVNRFVRPILCLHRVSYQAYTICHSPPVSLNDQQYDLSRAVLHVGTCCLQLLRNAASEMRTHAYCQQSSWKTRQLVRSTFLTSVHQSTAGVHDRPADIAQVASVHLIRPALCIPKSKP